MSWIRAADRLPPEGEQVIIHDDERGRMELGRYAGGAWYVEDPRDGRLTPAAGVTHWAWALDSQLQDDGDDD